LKGVQAVQIVVYINALYAHKAVYIGGLWYVECRFRYICKH